MSTRSARRRAAVWPARPWLIAFFLLTFALDIPFLVLGSLVRAPADVPLQLPFSALGFDLPAPRGRRAHLASAGTPRSVGAPPPRGRPASKALAVVRGRGRDHALRRADFRRPHSPTRAPAGPQTSLFAIPVLLVIFLLAAASEEVGWTGYATDPLQERLSPLRASLLLGVIWALFHVIPMVPGSRSDLDRRSGPRHHRLPGGHGPVYNRTGRSVLAPILFHALINVSSSLMPTIAWFWTPWVMAAVTLVPALLLLGTARAGTGDNSNPA